MHPTHFHGTSPFWSGLSTCFGLFCVTMVLSHLRPLICVDQQLIIVASPGTFPCQVRGTCSPIPLYGLMTSLYRRDSSYPSSSDGLGIAPNVFETVIAPCTSSKGAPLISRVFTVSSERIAHTLHNSMYRTLLRVPPKRVLLIKTYIPNIGMYWTR